MQTTPWTSYLSKALFCHGSSCSLPSGRAVIVAGPVEGTVPCAATEKPLHFVLVQVRFADVSRQVPRRSRSRHTPRNLPTCSLLLTAGRRTGRPRPVFPGSPGPQTRRADGGADQHIPQRAVRLRGTGSAAPAIPPSAGPLHGHGPGGGGESYHEPLFFFPHGQTASAARIRTASAAASVSASVLK